MRYELLPLEDLTLTSLLKKAGMQDVIFLTRHGKIRFALLHADEGDQEVLALRSNPEFMAYLAECTKRAKAGPTKSLAEVRKMYGLDNPKTRPTRRRRALAKR